MNINEIIEKTRKPDEIINDLKNKVELIPAWSVLEKEYDPKLHPVMTDTSYIDKVTKDGVEKVTRVTVAMQKLAVKRMTELAFGIPVKRIYKAVTEGEKTVAQVLERIYEKNRINSVNIERMNMLFAGCEVATLWYAVEEPNNYYGVNSKLKLRCKNYSPMLGDGLYPLFDEFDDLIALSFNYKRTIQNKSVEFFDTFTKNEYIKFEQASDGWVETDRSTLSLGKIPAIYVSRPTPIWEDLSNNVYEIEWSLSRNGNYLRKNSKPTFGVFADEDIKFGGEKDSDFKSVLQFPANAKAEYITWSQAIESLKFHVESLYRVFYTQLQLPDMSFDTMKTTPMSGEARKMMFVDAQLKVTDESGRLIEFLDRETNVLKAFLKIILPSLEKDIDSLSVETVITPFSIKDDTEKITNIITATAGKAVLSQREGIEQLGWSDDVDKTMKELEDEAKMDTFEPTM